MVAIGATQGVAFAGAGGSTGGLTDGCFSLQVGVGNVTPVLAGPSSGGLCPTGTAQLLGTDSTPCATMVCLASEVAERVAAPHPVGQPAGDLVDQLSMLVEGLQVSADNAPQAASSVGTHLSTLLDAEMADLQRVGQAISAGVASDVANGMATLGTESVIATAYVGSLQGTVGQLPTARAAKDVAVALVDQCARPQAGLLGSVQKSCLAPAQVLSLAWSVEFYLSAEAATTSSAATAAAAAAAQQVLMYEEYVAGGLASPPNAAAVVTAANQVVDYLDSNAPASSLPDAPDPSGLAVCTPSTLRQAVLQPDGGTVYTYAFADGKSVTYGVPLSDFEPTTAAAAQLAAYNYPPRPADGAAEAQWADALGTGDVTSTPTPCTMAGGTPTTAKATCECGVTGNRSNNTIWTGPVATAMDDAYYRKAVGTYLEPNWGNRCTTHSGAAVWTGIGGDGDYGQEALLQTGSAKDVLNSGIPYLWWEAIDNSGDNHSNPNPVVYSAGDNQPQANDQLTPYTYYAGGSGNPVFTVTNGTRKVKTAMAAPTFDGKHGYYSSDYTHFGRTAEFITEAEAGADPYKFSPVQWAGAVTGGRTGADANVEDRPYSTFFVGDKIDTTTPTKNSSGQSSFTSSFSNCT